VLRIIFYRNVINFIFLIDDDMQKNGRFWMFTPRIWITYSGPIRRMLNWWNV